MVRSKSTKIIVSTLIILFLMVSFVSADMVDISDDALLFSESAKSNASTIIDSIYEQYNVRTLIKTSDSAYQGSIEDEVDSLLRNHVGVDNNGLLLYINMATRDIYVNTSGDVIDMINDNRQDALLDNIINSLSDGNYDAALSTFLSQSQEYIKGGKITGNKRVESQSLSVQDAAMAGAGGLGTALLSFFGLKKGSTPKSSNMIYSLMENSNASFASTPDKLIDTRTTRTRIATPVISSGRSSGGGRSTVRRSSGGGSFSGRGRKF